MDTEVDYHQWTMTIAGQLLSQTPLEDVKYLDILGIVTNHTPLRRYSSTNTLTCKSKYKTSSPNIQEEVNNNELPIFGSRMYKKNVSHLPDLIRECEQLRRSPIIEFSDFTPVKQKCKMFEDTLIVSAKSVENLHNLSSQQRNVTSKSLYNLDLCAVPVKDICRYFESRFNANNTNSTKFRSLY